jgi:EpsI family protein
MVGGLFLAGLLAWAYYPAVVSLIESWSSSTQTYSYGFLVPVVSGWLVWARRDELRRIPVTHSFGWGTIVTSAGLLMLVAGHISTLSVLEEFSLIVTICGLTLLLLGPRMFRALVFPIGYLMAMIPVWDLLTARVHPYFQDFSASFGVATLRAFGIPVIRQGFFLELPNITLEVAQECSGVNNLIAVLCVGVPMTHLFLRSWWKRGLVLTAAVLIAALSNGVRVATVSVLAYYGIRGADGDIHGPYSLLRSLLVSGIGFVALFWLISWFRDDDAPGSAPPAQPLRIEKRTGPGLMAVVVAIVMLSTANGLIAWHRVVKVPLRADLGTFPERLGRWQATRVLSSSDVTALNFDEQLSRTYAAPDGAELNVFIGYYQEQGPGRELADYRMRESLLFGQTSRASMAGSIGTARDGSLKDFLVVRGRETYYITYWYSLGGRIVSQDYEAKLYTAWNSVARRTSDGAVVVVKTKSKPGESIEVARGRVGDFIEALIPATKLYLPISW